MASTRKKIEPELLELQLEQLTIKLKRAQEEIDALKSAPVSPGNEPDDPAAFRELLRKLRARIAKHTTVALDPNTPSRSRRIANLRADECGAAVAIVRGKEPINGHYND